MTTATEKMAAYVARLSTAQLIDSYAHTEDKPWTRQDAELFPIIRGAVMDELERRDPAAFEQWIGTGLPGDDAEPTTTRLRWLYRDHTGR